jgi:hypothetical protein
MSECAFLNSCPVWDHFKSDLKSIWIKNYCRGDKQDRCARKQLASEGREVPANLLPNGTTFEE